ncbi:MAG TPA: sensor domain-containing protein [Mycobacterium sp.]|nr:sensor domain-containing protein [Mycobacterium sp.]
MKRGVSWATALLLLVAGVAGCGRTVDGEAHVARGGGAATTDLIYSQSDLDRLLLSDAQINAIMGTKTMTTWRTYTGMPEAAGEVYSSPQCAVALFNTTVPAYHASGFVTARGRKIGEPSADALYHDIDEAVVAFQSAGDARGFVDAATKAWHDCSGRNVTYTDPGGQQDPWTIGVPRTVGPIIAIKNTSTDEWGCGHAMTTRANLVVDVDACGYTITDQAITIVRAITTASA